MKPLRISIFSFPRIYFTPSDGDMYAIVTPRAVPMLKGTAKLKEDAGAYMADQGYKEVKFKVGEHELRSRCHDRRETRLGVRRCKGDVTVDRRREAGAREHLCHVAQEAGGKFARLDYVKSAKIVK